MWRYCGHRRCAGWIVYANVSYTHGGIHTNGQWLNILGRGCGYMIYIFGFSQVLGSVATSPPLLPHNQHIWLFCLHPSFLKWATSNLSPHIMPIFFVQVFHSALLGLWTRSWKEYQNRTKKSTVAQAAPLSKNRLKAHTLLKTTESALATQIWTEKHWPSWLSPSTASTRIHLFSLPLWVVQTDPQACNHVLWTHQW